MPYRYTFLKRNYCCVIACILKILVMSALVDQHEAMVQSSKGSALILNLRQTPIPGPNEVLIKVNSIALNPVDHIQRDKGFHVASYPTVLGFDVSGTIHSIGSSVSGFAVGDRVLGMASSWFSGLPECGAFQQYVLVPSSQLTVIPSSMSFNEAAILPLAVYTAWFALLIAEIPRDAIFQENDKKGILIWGVGGSVGSIVMQIAKSMGFHVYATASSNHHSYLQELGKGSGKVTLFDYKDKDVNSKIINAAAQDGIVIDIGIEAAAGNLKDIVSILNKTKGTTPYAKISCAPFSFSMLWYLFVPSFCTGVKVKFVDSPKDANVRLQEFSFIYNTWLPTKLISGEIVPSPKVKVIPNGLNGIQNGLDELKKGVSGVKLVVEI